MGLEGGSWERGGSYISDSGELERRRRMNGIVGKEKGHREKSSGRWWVEEKSW